MKERVLFLPKKDFFFMKSVFSNLALFQKCPETKKKNEKEKKKKFLEQTKQHKVPSPQYHMLSIEQDQQELNNWDNKTCGV